MASIIIGGSNLFVGVLLFALGVPLFLKKVKMNRLYGARFKKSFESEENWYAINRYAGKVMMIFAVPIIIVAVVTFFMTFSKDDLIALIFALAPLLFIIPPVVLTVRYAKRL